jgi:signal transduction histidine kinase
MPWPIRRLLAALVLVVAIPLVTLLVSLFALEIARERADARETALRIARATAERLEGLHEESSEMLARLAHRDSIRHAAAGNCDSLFAIVEFFPQYADLFLIDSSRAIVCSTESVSQDPRAATARSWVRAEMAAGTFPLGRPVIRRVGDEWVAVLSTAVAMGPEAAEGVLVLVQLPQIVGEETLPRGTTVTIIDDEGRVVARSERSEMWEGRDARAAEVTGIVLGADEGSTAAAGLDGTPRQFGFKDMPDLGWHVYVGVPTREVMRPVRTLIVRGLVSGAVIIVTLSLFALWLSRRIEAPIEALARAAGEIAHAGFTRPIPVKGPREIATLGEAFNEMVLRRAEAEARMAESERNLKALSDRLLTVQEQERTTIAREIHDELGQSLTALKMDIGGILDEREIQPERGAKLRGRIRETLDEMVRSVQRISSELRPSALDDLGLVETLETEARVFEERTGIECELSFGPDGIEVDDRAASVIYRIVQEALTNVARHANATRAEIRLRRRADETILEIRDDGRGITPEEKSRPSSLGLIGMRERAALLGGVVHIEGIAGSGTIVSVRMPSAGSAS